MVGETGFIDGGSGDVKRLAGGYIFIITFPVIAAAMFLPVLRAC